MSTLLTLLLLALAACGGSGSSGFDVSPLTEEEALASVFDAGECADYRGLTLCPASSPTGQIPGNGGPVAPRESGIVLDVPPTDSLDCSIDVAAGACSYTLVFATSGLPGDASFRAAVRTLEPAAGKWVVGEALVSPGEAQQLPLEIPARATSVQVALLVFADGEDTSPGAVEELLDTGAIDAFVTGVLAVEPAF